MAIFQSVESMRTRLGFPDRDDINSAILGALKDTTLAMEAGLRTKFTRGTVIDEFMVLGRSYGRSQSTKLIKLDLSRGFVDEGETIAAYIADTRAGLDDSGARLDLRNIDTGLGSADSLIVEDAERGRVIITDVSAPFSYVRITYTAGLTTEGGDPDIFASPPDWLVYLATIRTELNALSNPVLNPGVTAEPNNRKGSEPPHILEMRRALEDGFHDHVCIGPGYTKPIKKTFTAAA